MAAEEEAFGQEWEAFGEKDFPALMETLLLPSKTDGVFKPLEEVVGVMDQRVRAASDELERLVSASGVDDHPPALPPGLHRFLTLHVPSFTECLFRRDVRGAVEVGRVQSYLQLVLSLISRSMGYWDLEELALTLHLLMGGVLAPTFTSFCPKGHVFNDGFYIFHGKPQYKNVNGRAVYYWPDDETNESTEVQGSRAVGRGVELVLDGQTVTGVVADYRERELLVRFNKGREGEQWVKVDDHKLRWLTKEGGRAMEELKFSKDDIGTRVKVYWAKDRVYYKGVVSDYNEENGAHTISYDDGDVRLYDMKTRDYQVISAATAEAQPAGGSASPSSSSQPRTYCRRPAASQSYFSCYLLSNINYFGQLGGFDAMMARVHEAAEAGAATLHEEEQEQQGGGRAVELEELEGEQTQEEAASPRARPLSLACLKIYVSTLHHLRPRLETDVLDELIFDLKEALPSVLLTLDDEQAKQLSKSELRELMAMLGDLLLVTASTRAAAAMATESLQLGLACRLFKTWQLEKRLLGLTLIKEAIGRLGPQPVATRSIAGGGMWTQSVVTFTPKLPPKTVGSGALDEAFVLRWLGKSRVVEELFGARMHIELVPRSEGLIRFMAGKGMITNAHLDAIWSCTVGKHEAVVRVLYSFIVGLVPHLTPPLRLFLFSRIASLPFSRYDQQTLQIVYDFTINALQAQRAAASQQQPPPPPSSSQPPPLGPVDRGGSEDGSSTTGNGGGSGSVSLRKGQVMHSPERDWFGFGVLWRYIQDDKDRDEGSTLSVELTAKAVQLLVQLLGERECSGEKEALLNKCINNIKRHRSVPQSLLVMSHTLSTYPSPSKSWLAFPSRYSKETTVTTIIDMLEKSQGLLSLLFADLQWFHNEVRRAYLPPSKPLPSESFNDKRVRLANRSRSRYSYLQHLQGRLDFLTYLLSNSGLRLEMGHVDTLWTCYVEQGLTAKAGDLLVEWLSRLSHTQTAGDGVTSTAQEPPTLPSLGSISTTSSAVTATSSTSGSMGGGAGAGAGGSGAAAGPPTILEGGSIMQEPALLGDPLLHALFQKKIPSLPVPAIRPSAAALYLQLFLYVNGRSKAVRKADGEAVGWVRHGPKLEGLDTLWEMALDARDQRVSEGAISLLIELHHRFSAKLKPKAEDLRGALVSTCLSKIQESLPALASSTTSYSVQLAGLRVSRSVQILTLFLARFGEREWAAGSKAGGGQAMVDIIIQAGRNESTALELRLPASCTIRLVREKVATHFSEQTSAVLLYKKPSAKPNASTERLDHDSNTLEEEGWHLSREPIVVLAKKNDKTTGPASSQGSSSYPTKATPNRQDQPPAAPADLIKPSDLEPDATESNVLESQSWLWSEVEGQLHITALPPPLPHKPDMVFSKASGPPPDSAAAMPLSSHFKQHPEHLDQLFALLELDREVLRRLPSLDLQAAVWDILQCLPTHPSILHDIRTMAFLETGQWDAMFRERSVYKLLYRLQILDAFLSAGASSSTTIPGLSDWQLSFVHHGGIESLAGALHQMTNVARQLPTTTSAASFGAAKMDDGLPSSEIVSVTMALLCRVLHSFLSLDPSYSTASLRPLTSGGCRGASPLPDRAALALIDVANTVTESLDALFCLAKARAKPSERSLLSAVQHVLLLVAGCTARGNSSSGSKQSSSKGELVLKDYPRLPQWVAAFTLKVPSDPIRQAVASSLLHMCETELLVSSVTTSTTTQRPRSGSGSSSPSLVLLPLLLHIMLGRLDQAAEIFQPPSSSTPSDRQHPPSRLSDGAGSPALGGTLNASISSSHEFLILLAALLQLAVRPRTTLRGNYHLRIRRQRGRGGDEEEQEAEEEGDVLGGLEEEGEEEREKRVAGWGLDLDGLCRQVGRWVGRCRPAVWLSEPKIADETFGGLIRVAVVLAHGSRSRKEELGKPGRAEVSRLYHAFLFPQLGNEDDEIAAAETLGAMYVCNETRGLVYRLLVELCDGVSSNWLELMSCLGTGLLQQSQDQDDKAAGIKLQEVVEALLRSNRQALASAPVRQFKWDYDPQSQLRDPKQHVGLKNQGATCYMNSLLQQLYHIPDFRTGILGIEAKDSGEPGELEKSVLFQLQALFASLQTSEKKSSDTLSFCKTLTDYSGEPIRLQEQKDVNEFCSMLFDKLESLDPRLDKLLKSLFGGVQTNQIISRECPHRSERSEPFTMLTADIKNKHSLEQSLELYVTGEVLGGDNKYHCSECNAKVEALRRTALQTLPPMLIIHLKRFEFNLETMTKFKVNDLCSFPMLLDMEPFTADYLARKEDSSRSLNMSISHGGAMGDEDEDDQQGGAAALMNRSGSLRPGSLEDGGGGAAASLGSNMTPSGSVNHHPAGANGHSGEYRYELRGVVAHVGTADSGHYYSFIRSRCKQEDGRTPWFEYNDQLVLPFDEDNIPRECFGGVEAIGGGTTAKEQQSAQRVRNNNAYLLFYEKVVPAATSVLAKVAASDPGILTTTLPASPNGKAGTSGGQGSVATDAISSPSSATQALFERRVDRSDSISAYVGGSAFTGAGRFGGAGLGDNNTPLPGSVRREVWRENMTFFKDKHLFAKSHSRFLWHLLKAEAGMESSASPERRSLIRSRAFAAGLRFLVEVVVRARALSCVPLWAEFLRGLMARDRLSGGEEEGRRARPPPTNKCAEWAVRFLADDNEGREALLQVLMVCPHPSSRREVVGLVADALRELRPAHAAHYTDVRGTPDNSAEGGGAVQLFCPSSRLASLVLALIDQCAGEDAREAAGSSSSLSAMALRPSLNYYFITPEVLRLVGSFARMGQEERALLVALRTVQRLSALVMSFRPGGDNRGLLNGPAGEECLALALRLLVALVVEDEAGRQSVLSCPTDREALASRRFVEVAAQHYPEEASQLLCAACKDCPEPALSVGVVQVLVERFIEATNVPQGGGQTAAVRTVSFRPFLQVLQDVLTVVDRDGGRLQEARLEATLPLADRCSRLALRRTALDLDVMYHVVRLYLSASTSSPTASVFVAQRILSMLNDWRRQLAPALHAPPPTQAEPRG